jgi:CRP-like cAMP-binding protein
MGSVHAQRPQNRLLAAFPQEDLQRFFSDLHPVSLPLRHVLYDVGAPLEYVYFIEQGLASILMNMSNGSSIEVGMIGREGMVGMPVVLGALTSNRQFIVQSPLIALRMNAVRCKAEFEQSAAVRRVILRFANAILDLAAQTAACNRLHSIEQRCARWLLMSSDRIDSEIMPMTHDFLSSMLGVRRAGGYGDPRRTHPLRADRKWLPPCHDHRPRGP